MREQPLLFGEMKSLIGILADSPRTHPGPPRPAVILLNPGIVHRVGPGRIYVKIARILAETGFTVLRFDFSGIGDSAVRQDSLPFEKSAVSEAQEAMDFLQRAHNIDRFILMGGCSGAVISLEAALNDPRVIGAVLINFPFTQDQDENAPDLALRRAAHYYRNFALVNPRSWQKLCTGKANYRFLLRVMCSEVKRRVSFGPGASPESPLLHSLRCLADRGVRVTLVCSEGDPSLEELHDTVGKYLRQLSHCGSIAVSIVRRSDHTFTSLYDQEQLLELILERVQTMAQPVENLSNSREPLCTENIVLQEGLTRQSSL
ncbi:MAG: hypothetical protein DMG60_02065 [Acidobacteria bacterium]|nr:MAG: hypothetical protein DMG60_02065 [Acidobacteriota bacterium]